MRGAHIKNSAKNGLNWILVGVVVLLCCFGVAGGGIAGAQTEPAANQPSDEPSTDTTTTTVASDGSEGPRVQSSLVNRATDEPIEGVDVVVAKDGEEIARGTSDAEGFVLIPLEETGQFEVSLDPDTLPEGVGFREGAPESLKPLVQASRPTPVIFQLQDVDAEIDNGSAGNGARFLSLLLSGTRFGLVIAVASVGLSLIFGTTGLTNFAHGEMVTFGAVAAWYLNDPSGIGLTLVFATVGGIILSGLFGIGLDVGLFRPLRDRGMSNLSSMVVSIGLAFVLRYLIQVVFGAGPRQYSQYAAQSPSIDLGPINARPKDLFIILVCVIVLMAVGIFLSKSRLGTAIRAVSDNRDLAESSGIDVRQVTVAVWALSGALAGLGGIMFGITDTVTWDMGKGVLLVMFAAVVLGGLGTTYGAMAGGLVVGIVSDLSTFWLDSDLKIVVALATLILVLLVRPQGIFGVKGRTG